MKLVRMTTVGVSLKHLLTGQFEFMSAHGFEVFLISSDDKAARNAAENESVSHLGVKMSRRISPIADLFALLKLIGLFRKLKPDIIHTHTPKAGLLGMMAAKFCGIKHRIHTVAGLPQMTMSGWKAILMSVTERVTYACANSVWPNSLSLLRYIKQQNLCREEKLKIIGNGSSNGIDLERFSKDQLIDETLDTIKNNINYSKDNYYLLAIGRIVRDKGIPELVKAFSSFKKQYPNVKLVLLGVFENNRRGETIPKDVMQRIKNDEDILFMGWQDDIEYYLSLCDLLVHASHREGFPNVLLQAGALKCPVLCSDIPGNTDIVQNTKTGLYFGKGDSQELLDKLVYAYTHRPKMSEYAESLHAYVLKHYSRRLFHNTLLMEYQYIIGQDN